MLRLLRPRLRVPLAPTTPASRLLAAGLPGPRSLPHAIHRDVFRNAAHSRRAFQTVHVQRVKVRRKWFRPRAFLIACIIYYLCYHFYTETFFSVLNKLLDGLDEDELAELEEEEDDEEEDESILFLPIPFTTRKEPVDWYRGSGPEWQTFMRIAKDRNYMHSVKVDLVNICRGILADSPVVTSKFGMGVKVKHVHLYDIFPNMAPPTYVRMGISYEEDGIYLKEKEIDPLTVSRIRRALYPSIATRSLWSFATTLTKQNLDSAMQALGFGSEASSSEATTMQSFEKAQKTIDAAHQRLRGTTDPKGQQAGPSPPQPPRPDQATEVNASSAVKSTAAGDNAGASLPPGPSTAGEDEEKARRIYFPMLDLKDPTSSFWRKLSSLWRPLYVPPPRGSFGVSGTIEFELPRAWIVMEVGAFFDPETDKFHRESLSFRVKNIQLKRQSPKLV